jgi:hypothetical protein
MRQQLEYLQAELCTRSGGSSEEVQVLSFYFASLHYFQYFPIIGKWLH